MKIAIDAAISKPNEPGNEDFKNCSTTDALQLKNLFCNCGSYHFSNIPEGGNTMKEDRNNLEILATAIMEAYYEMTGTFLPDEAEFLRNAAAQGEAPFVHAISIVFGCRVENVLLEAAISAQKMSQWITCNCYFLYLPGSDVEFSFENQLTQFNICKCIVAITKFHFPTVYLQCVNIAKKTMLSAREGRRRYIEYRNAKQAVKA